MKYNSRSGGVGVWGLSFGAAIFVAMVAGPHLREPVPVDDTCLRNLAQIDEAKDEWALENIGLPGDVVSSTQVEQFMYDCIPRCPDGGTYTYNAVCSAPTCSLKGPAHELP